MTGGTMGLDHNFFDLDSREDFRILSLAALFKKDFSIDWVQDLAEVKTSKILATFEKSIEKKILVKKQPGMFLFADRKQKQQLRDAFEPRKRKRLHKQAVEIILQDLSDDDRKARKVAFHLLQLSNDTEGCGWLVQAGDAFLKDHDYQKALDCYDKVLRDLKTIKGDDADGLFIDTAIKYSKISTAAFAPSEVIVVLKEAMQRAEAGDKRQYQALLEMHIAKNEWLRSRYKTALHHFDRGWALSKEITNPKLKHSIVTFNTIYPMWYGRYRDVVISYEKSIPEVERLPTGKFSLFAGTIVGQSYAVTGQITQGLGMLDAIRTHCRKTKDFYVASTAGLAIGMVMCEIHRFSDAINCLLETLEDADRGHCNWAKIIGAAALANAYYYTSDHKKMLTHLEQYLQLSERVEMRLRIFPYLLNLLWPMETGEIASIPGLSLDKEINRAKRASNIYTKGIAYRYQALAQRKQGQAPKKILKSLKLSIKYLTESGHQMELAKTNCELARHFLENGEEEKAKYLVLNTDAGLGGFSENLIPDDLKYLAKDNKSKAGLLKDILSFSQEFITIKDRKELVRHIISTINHVTGAERGAIFIREKNPLSAKLVLRAAKNLTPEDIALPGFKTSIKMIDEVAKTGKGKIMVADLNKNGITRSRDMIRSRICFPMILRDQIEGVLYHDNRMLSSAFKESDLEIMAYFAAQAAVAIENAENYAEIQRLNQKLKEEKHYFEEQHLENLHYEEIVGKSPALMKVLEAVDKVAHTDASVLIQGETGVGKELVARAIHRNSPRCEKPFIRVHCSALPETLIPSELFGHEKGAFTGAIDRRIGRFELADNGTLFIDEIGELPLDVQVRFLRILQSGEFERIGGSETIRSDFRLIAATNRNIEKRVSEGKFREDLFYRINVFPIYVPPLRDRKEDIPLLAHYFLRIYATKMAKPIKDIPELEIEQLLGYDWPGNVRELENIIERGTILTSGTQFKVPDSLMHSTRLSGNLELVSLQENERRHILSGLRKANGKVHGPGGAAELLDINPSTLLSRMKKLGIKRYPKSYV
jgi:transcriptional regulator with GAF, ATPase, and Fis domain